MVARRLAVGRWPNNHRPWTVAGAGALIAESDDPPSQLRINVTSKGGTTAAALAVLMADDGMAPLLERAIRAARDRSIELGG